MIHSVIIRHNKLKTYKLIFLILTIVVSRTYAQNGFVKTMSDSIVEGFIRYDYNLYDPEKGDPSGNINPGTSFDDIPDDWVCPICGASKDDFSPV